MVVGGSNSDDVDESERLAFEAQLNSAILRRCYSEPSPARFVVQPARPAPVPARGSVGEGRREEPASTAGGRSWRVHEVVATWLQMFKPLFCWLWSAWERRRRKEQDAARAPPATVPRVRLMDYLC